jgi:hypothetical protein
MDNLARFEATTQNQTLANGAILVDDFDPIIFDDVLREFAVWNIIQKIEAVGDFTNGFDQTAVGNARAADKRSMSYSGTSPTRTARTAKEIKAIVRDLTFGMYDRSVYAAQGKKFGDLDAKDVRDMMVSCLRLWSDKFYNGDTDNDPNEFDGLKDSHLIGAGTSVLSTASVVKSIKNQVVSMMNSSARDVLPTHVLVNAQVREYISQEYRKDGDKMADGDATFGQGANARTSRVQGIDTAAGFLPVIVDRFLSIDTSVTPSQYPTFIVSADKLSWQYIPPLGNAGPEPKVFEIAMTNALDIQHKAVMFGAVELLGSTNHHSRLNVEARTTVVSPTA